MITIKQKEVYTTDPGGQTKTLILITHLHLIRSVILNGPFISDCGMKLCVFTYAVCILYILVSFLFSCTAFRALRSVVLQSPLAICRKGEVCELFTDNKNIHTVSEGDRLRTSDILSSGM